MRNTSNISSLTYLRSATRNAPRMGTAALTRSHTCWLLGLLAGCLLGFTPGSLKASTPADLIHDLGTAASSRLSMHFEVTFMKIDVAHVDAFLSSQDAAAIQAIPEATAKNERREQITNILLAAQPCAMSMTFLRDSSWKRILKGTRKNLEAAAEEKIITDEEFQIIWSQFVNDFTPMEERGVKKGDAIYYRVDPGRVRIVFFDENGNALVEAEREGDAQVRGTRGAYFGLKSRFSKKLIESLEKN